MAPPFLTYFPPGSAFIAQDRAPKKKAGGFPPTFSE
jgi:hypothetical protein